MKKIIMNEDGSADGVEVHHYKVGEIYAKQVQLRAGRVLIGHRHDYDHLSILALGSVSVLVEGVCTVYTAPAGIGIGKGKVHEVTALKNSLWYCVHAVPEGILASQADNWLVS